MGTVRALKQPIIDSTHSARLRARIPTWAPGSRPSETRCLATRSARRVELAIGEATVAGHQGQAVGHGPGHQLEQVGQVELAFGSLQSPRPARGYRPAARSSPGLRDCRVPASVACCSGTRTVATLGHRRETDRRRRVATTIQRGATSDGRHRIHDGHRRVHRARDRRWQRHRPGHGHPAGGRRRPRHHLRPYGGDAGLGGGDPRAGVRPTPRRPGGPPDRPATSWPTSPSRSRWPPRWPRPPRRGAISTSCSPMPAARSPWGPSPRPTLDAVRATIDLNMVGTFLCLKHGAPLMAAGVGDGMDGGPPAGGSFIGMSSGAGHFPHRYLWAYGSAKAGIDMLCKYAAEELGHSRHAGQLGAAGDRRRRADVVHHRRWPAARRLPGARCRSAGWARSRTSPPRCGSWPDRSPDWITGEALAVDGGHHLRRGANYGLLFGA